MAYASGGDTENREVDANDLESRVSDPFVKTIAPLKPATGLQRAVKEACFPLTLWNNKRTFIISPVYKAGVAGKS